MLLATVVSAFGCTSYESEEATLSDPDMLVTVRDGAITAPGSIESGWSRIRVEEDGNGHIVVIFRMPSDTSIDVATFLAALDTARATPLNVVAMGGPEVGDAGEILVNLTEGTYVLGCVRRGDDGHRHANSGESATFEVIAPSAVAKPGGDRVPVATVDVPMADFAYIGSDQWRAGEHLLRVENRGAQEHQLRIDRLADGSIIADWAGPNGGNKHGSPVAGVARLGPGEVVYLPVALPAGEYVLYCLIPELASGKLHIEMGMLRGIHVK